MPQNITYSFLVFLGIHPLLIYIHHHFVRIIRTLKQVQLTFPNNTTLRHNMAQPIVPSVHRSFMTHFDRPRIFLRTTVAKRNGTHFGGGKVVCKFCRLWRAKHHEWTCYVIRGGVHATSSCTDYLVSAHVSWA
jgi:hypothetical protein